MQTIQVKIESGYVTRYRRPEYLTKFILNNRELCHFCKMQNGYMARFIREIYPNDVRFGETDKEITEICKAEIAEYFKRVFLPVEFIN